MNEYSKYSGLAFQMLAVIGLCVWGGIWLDKHFAMKFPVFTLVLALLGFTGALLSVYRTVMRK